VAGRWCEVTNLPLFRVHIPIERRGETVARLVVGGSDHAFAVHDAFRRGLTLIAIAGLIAVVVLTVGFTVPLRRMRRSMDRIAEGDLDHRVMVRGGDEVAAMGHSFNAMAARIGSVLTGQKELLAGVSHELRSPLARMAVLTELLRDKAPADRIDDLEAEIDVIDGLVGELLLASRFDLGAEPMDLGNHTLAGLIEEAWSRVGVQLDFSGLRLIQNLDRESTTVRVDRALAVRILRNLFQNAARYVKRGTVTVTAQRRGDRVEITVADDGPGVRREQLERLFEPFYRGDAARSRGTDAVGLGLMIVRRAVEAHGGTVQARVGAAGGLAVGFDLPAA
jgi:signal transduction histidine kinase